MQKRKFDHSDSTKLAGVNYNPANLKSNSELMSGLAMTHEQVSDTYVEGTIDGLSGEDTVAD
ncbi:YozQ family protein [Bacillus sp. FSL K6-3431]|uniref:YozQ family protein n=1 Tax=Bacillus sp. FSL K6-3431 TaxID=2921500 RepID=UPI0030FB40B4